jgi:hypothetical protein
MHDLEVEKNTVWQLDLLTSPGGVPGREKAGYLKNEKTVKI